MYKFNPNFDIPKKPGARIWRYMDFTTFVSVLHKSALFFPRADKLDDPFEGSFPKANIEQRADMAYLSEYYRMYLKLTVINSWHLNGYESAAMWKLYLKSNEGIAIRSTFDRLTRSFTDRNAHKINVAKVKYINYTRDPPIREDSLSPYFHKRKNFQHERELRAVIQEFRYKKNGDICFDRSPFGDGLYVPVDLDLLVDRVYVAPGCPPWQRELVESVLDKYGLDKTVVASRLYTRDSRIVY